MIVKHSYLHKVFRRMLKNLVRVKNSDVRTKSITSNLLFSTLFILATSSSFATPKEQEVSYGPIKAGQTLWDVAEETRANKNISIEQQVYALYKANSNAFKSGNMNVLRKGIQLQIPTREFVTKTSSKEAKKQLSKHVHAIEVLRVDAKHLKIAKINTRQYKQRIKKIQKQLGKYRYESKDWNNTYLKLVKAKRNYKKSKRNVAKLHGLLLEKATLKYTKPTPQDIASEVANETNKRLTQIQSSLSDLNQSNTTLTEKVNELSSLNDRVAVLEEELGKNDEVVIQLKNTLESLQDTIKKTTEEQNRQNKEHREKFEKLSALKNIATNKVNETAKVAKTLNIVQTNPDTKTESNKEVETENKGAASVELTESRPEEKIKAEKITPETTSEQSPSAQKGESKEIDVTTTKLPEEIETEEKVSVKKDKSDPDLTSTSVEYIKKQSLKAGLHPKEVKHINDDNSAGEESSEKDTPKTQPQTIKKESVSTLSTKDPKENTTEDASGLGFTPTEYIKMQALKAGFSPAEIESLSEEKTKEATETLSTAKHLNEVIPQLKKTNKKLTKFQAGSNDLTTSSRTDNLLSFLKENIILIGGLLNGLILIFVIVRIRANKQSPLTVEDFRTEKK